MSDVSIVVVGVVAVLSAFALVTWLARPSEFRSVRYTRPVAPARPAPQVSVPAPAIPKPVQQPPTEISRPASSWPRTITRGTSDQATTWAKPPSYVDRAEQLPDDDPARQVETA